MKKTYEEFCNYVEMNILNEMSDKAERTVSVQDVTKNNNLKLKGLTILKSGHSIAPTIYLEPYYEEYYQGFKSLDSVLCEIASYYETAESGICRQFDFMLLQEQYIICSIVSKIENEAFLIDIPHVTICEDFALIFKYYIPSKSNEGCGTITITDSLAEMYGLSTEKLLELALVNTPKLLPVKFNSMFELLDDSFLLNLLDEEIVPMYVLTNKQNIQGAATLLYPETRELLLKKFDGDLILFPSSIHEWIILPADKIDDFSDLSEMVQSANETSVSTTEKLGEKAYILHYEALKDTNQLFPIFEPVESYRV